MDAVPYEIERKYLIRRPSQSWLDLYAERSEIVQTYIVRPEDGGRARVRMRRFGEKTIYTYTVKQRVNDLRSEEWENEITEGEYRQLLALSDPKRATINKTRYCLPYLGQIFEIDLYPFWSKQAVMEIELQSENAFVKLPPWIEVLREVTGEREYRNAEIARRLANAQPQIAETERR